MRITTAGAKARRDVEPSPVVAEFGADYWDAFRISDVDGVPPSTWAALALRGSEKANRAFATLVWHGLLSFDLAPRGAAGTLVGWRVTTDDPDTFVLDVDGSRSSGRMVFARSGPDPVWTTMLRHHGRAGAPVWAVLGNAHRALAPRCLEQTRDALLARA